jgi:hypothetical protein
MIEVEFSPLVNGYLDYLRDMRKLSHRTIIDIRCTFKKRQSRAVGTQA